MTGPDPYLVHSGAVDNKEDGHESPYMGPHHGVISSYFGHHLVQWIPDLYDYC